MIFILLLTFWKTFCDKLANINKILQLWFNLLRLYSLKFSSKYKLNYITNSYQLVFMVYIVRLLTYFYEISTSLLLCTMDTRT